MRSIYSNYKKPYVSKSQVGKKAYNVLESDITAVVNGYHLSTYNTLDWLGAYNINGKTIIPFDILEIFGTVQWDANARKISLWIPGIGNMGGGSKDASTVKNEFLARMKAIDAKTESLYGSAMTQQKMNSVSWLGYCMWDGMLNEVYQYLKIHRLSAQEFEMLKNDQIRWVNERDQQMKKVEREYQGGSICALMVNSTGMEYIENRCRYLISLF